MDCEQIYQEAAKKIAENYRPLVDENNRVITNMQNRGLDASKYYDAKNDQIIDLVTIQGEITAKIAEQLNQAKEKVQNDCGNIVDALQYAVDTAMAYFTEGVSLILPKHMTHIDVAEILKGNVAGGENSFVNEVKDRFYSVMGFGKNHSLRQILDNPVDVIGEILGGIGIKL